MEGMFLESLLCQGVSKNFSLVFFQRLIGLFNIIYTNKHLKMLKMITF